VTEPTTLVTLPPKWRYSIIAICTTVVAMFIASTVLGFVFAGQSYQRSLQSQRQICGLIVTLDDVYRSTPPTTATGRNFATQLHIYRVSLGC
jgi:cell division protein FtsX